MEVIDKTELLHHKIGLLINQSGVSDVEAIGVLELIKSCLIESKFNFDSSRNELVESEINKQNG